MKTTRYDIRDGEQSLFKLFAPNIRVALFEAARLVGSHTITLSRHMAEGLCNGTEREVSFLTDQRRRITVDPIQVEFPKDVSDADLELALDAILTRERNHA